MVPPAVNLSVKLDANIFIGDRYVWLFYDFADLAAKCLFPHIMSAGHKARKSHTDMDIL